MRFQCATSKAPNSSECRAEQLLNVSFTIEQFLLGIFYNAISHSHAQSKHSQLSATYRGWYLTYTTVRMIDPKDRSSNDGVALGQMPAWAWYPGSGC